MPHVHDRRQISDEDRRRFLKALGAVGATTVAGDFTLDQIRGEVTLSGSGELAAIGEAIRSDLSGSVDASLLASEMGGITASLGRLPQLEAAGLPAEQGTAYQELTEPAWNIHEHLVEIGFFASAEEHMPPFVADHIEASARQLVGTGSLSPVLADAGFSTEEITALATTVVNNNDHLAKWKPTAFYAQEGVEEFDPADIAPLHQRATEGALLWIDGLDHWLWQNQVLLTEEMLANGIWDIKAMLGGYQLVSQAAHDMAAGSISDEELSAMITAGSAASIISQEHLAFDLARPTDEARAPRGGA